MQPKDDCTFVPHFEAASRSAKLAFRGEHGERRKLGLSVGAGLHSCKHIYVHVRGEYTNLCNLLGFYFLGDELYRERREFRAQLRQEDIVSECTFVPELPGKESFMRNQLRSNSSHQALSSSGPFAL